jgi:hypothetical protein
MTKKKKGLVKGAIEHLLDGRPAETVVEIIVEDLAIGLVADLVVRNVVLDIVVLNIVALDITVLSLVAIGTHTGDDIPPVTSGAHLDLIAQATLSRIIVTERNSGVGQNIS